MDFVNASTQGSIRLMDLLGEMIGLQYIQDGPEITSTIEGQVVKSYPAQAEVFHFTGGKVERPGTTLVFPQVIQNTIKAQAPQVVLGRLTKREQKGDSSRHVALLEPLTDAEAQAFVSAATTS